MPINPDQIYRAHLVVESVGNSDHFRVAVTYDPPVTELNITSEFDAIPTSFGIVSGLIPHILGEHSIDLDATTDNDDVEALPGETVDNVVSLFPHSDTTH
jgi:hypothetical protein